jgi:SAM-dependent methyltransferase
MLVNKLTRHHIDGDTRLNVLQKFQYTYFFLIEIFQDKRQNTLPANEPNLSEFFKLYNNNYDVIAKKSPSRICCEYNTFLYLKKFFSINDNVKILDVGCGNGTSIDLFSRYFKSFTYQGCDKFRSENWGKLEKENITFFTHNLGEKTFKKSENFDLIYSQSVFEHVENDLAGFLSIREKFSSAKQIHYLPAPLSFLNYLKHGYRRYSHKSLLKLENCLNTKITIQNIGGKRAFGLYFPFYNNFTKRKHIFNFLRDRSVFNNNKKYLTFLLNDNSKSLPIFYEITF